ncbi:hypothetical protein H641_09738 [Cutibacterium granulosum DSM 20700]|uniref:Uncharacterized protein n=1 Tax=Cutibacterium granulosum DSM 20700 TaxID=1160719 RepID=U1F6I6_9ACTN|nr:hypothetical protein H641_09738 [Cutibacterium granulosum DSM 20700]
MTRRIVAHCLAVLVLLTRFLSKVIHLIGSFAKGSGELSRIFRSHLHVPLEHLREETLELTQCHARSMTTLTIERHHLGCSLTQSSRELDCHARIKIHRILIVTQSIQVNHGNLPNNR